MEQVNKTNGANEQVNQHKAMSQETRHLVITLSLLLMMASCASVVALLLLPTEGLLMLIVKALSVMVMLGVSLLASYTAFYLMEHNINN